MSFGYVRRDNFGLGSAATGDTFSGTIPLDSRYDIVPGSVRIYKDPNVLSLVDSMDQGTLVAIDDGVTPTGSFVLQPPYDTGGPPYAFGSIIYSNGAFSFDENGYPGTVIFGASDRCMVESYQRNPSVSDDFEFSYGALYSKIILDRYPHSSFATNNLTNHGTNCLLIRQPAAFYRAGYDLIYNDANFTTDQPIMSQIAIRAENIPSNYVAPKMIQRKELLTSQDRTGYIWGPWTGTTQTFVILSSGNDATYSRSYQWSGATVGAQYTYNTGSARNYSAQHLPADLAVDDWNLWRMTTTIEGDDLHIHMQIARGATQVDAANPTFDKWADVWHVLSNTVPVVDTTGAIPRAGSATSTWLGEAAHGMPPTKGRQGLRIASVDGLTLVNSRVWCDSYKLYRMP